MVVKPFINLKKLQGALAKKRNLKLAPNVLWLCVCLPLAQSFKLPTTLMANLLIYRVSSRFFIYKFKTNNI